MGGGGGDKINVLKPVLGIRIRVHKLEVQIRILPFSHKCVEWTEKILAK